MVKDTPNKDTPKKETTKIGTGQNKDFFNLTKNVLIFQGKALPYLN